MSDPWMVDSVDDHWVRLEDPDGAFHELPRAWLPEAVAEGHVLRVDVGGEGLERSVRFTIDEAATVRRRSAMGALRERLQRGPAGDFDL